MVMSMDAINDQTMSSTFDDSATINSDSYKQQESADDELNDDELSKGSSQTVVVKRQQQQLQQQQQQHQSVSVDEDDDEKCHQPMIVSRGSSIDEDQKQTKMNLDEDSSSDEPLPPPTTKSVTKTEEYAGMKQPPTTATSLRLASGMDSKNSRVDSLVAQMRDIVDGGQTSRMNTETSTKREHHHEDNRPQPKSSSDSLNNQNEINTSKTSIEGVGAQKRTRRTRGHCRHGHHHHHHHGGHQRHKQDSEKSSIVGVDNAGGGGGGTRDSASQGHNPHQHHHHHHHRHQTSISSTHRPHAHSHSHPHHHHHHHHHGHHHHPHHQHHHQGERPGTMSKRSSIQRPSLALIDPTGGSLNLVSGTCQIGDEEDENLTNRDLNSSMSSTSSNPAAVGQQTSKQASQQNINNNPNQSYPESKSSESPPDEKNSGEVDNATTEMQQQQRQRETDKSQEQNPGNQQHHQHRHHHHHHHRCHHRSHKKRLALDPSNDFKSSTKAEEQEVQILGAEEGTKREVLGDLKSSLNTSPAAAARQLDHENHCEAHSISKGASHSHGHPHSHSHHHHHHPHPHHHHHVHCVASAHKLTDDNNNNEQSKSTEEQQANKAQHHHHHRHHKHHHHYHHHGHHCKQHRHKTRRKSDVQSNVDLPSSRDQANNQSTSTAGGRAKLDSLNNNDCSVANAKLTGADEPTTNQRRTSSVSAAGGAGGKMNMDLELTNGMQTIINDKQEAKEDDVVDMEMSPSNERRSSRVQQQTCESSSSTNVPAASGPGASMTTAHEAAILRSIRQDVVGSEARHASQLNALNQQDNNDNQMQIQSTKDVDKNNSNQCSIEPNQKSTQNDESSGYKFSSSYESNQENLYKNSNVGDVSGRENKLVRQMSSHSSKKSQKDDVGRDGESQSQQLADYAPRPLQSASNQQLTQATQIIESSVPNDRRCRLCWCCCCPCSALSVREVTNRTDTVKTDADPSNSPTTKFPPTPNVPLEEVRSWGESFDKLMRCQAGRKVFQDFLRCEYSEENILFWTACEDLKKERDSKSIASKARDIYEDYISILSSKEVSLDSRVRDVINNNIKKPTSNIFDEAQLQIYTLMHRDSYPRFINSNMYKKLAQLSASNSSRKSSS